MSILPRCFFVASLLSISVVVGCAAPPRPAPISAAFRPAPGKGELWLSTPIAIEVENEHEARALEAAECDYIGEIDIRGAAVRRGDMALVAAHYGATHYRPVITTDPERTSIILRTSILLYRIERHRWAWLPDELRPTPPAL